MNSQYFPVVRAKAGEIEALKNLSKLDKASLERCTPIFEITKLEGKSLEAARKKSNTPFEDYLDARAHQIAEIFIGKHVILDVSQWPIGFSTEGGEQILSYICNSLSELGVLVCPVIGYDRWEAVEYRETIKSMVLPEKAFYCIRLDSLAIEDLGDVDHLDEIIEDMVLSAGLNERSTPVLIDIGDVTKLPMQDVMEIVETAYGHMKGLGFEYIIMAASSIPDSIDKAVKDRDSSNLVQRKEMIVWKGFLSANPTASLYFGDYGVRNPRSSDAIATNMNVKIRYTVNNAFFVVRGHSVKGEDGFAQSQKLSKKIVESIHYRGVGFSWGDAKIMQCSLGKLIGSPTNWISYDTNHHLKTVVGEIHEFTTQLAAVAERV
ncbi:MULTISPECIES: beta family protein [unclassified Pseudomonas]|uniref:beta family protein n=1 Tax=unclassified Pseudomonas TaxID=196821 RepID=UPI000A1E2C2C|nr:MULTISPECIES: beta family protein [unclassified Pseudomonas]